MKACTLHTHLEPRLQRRYANWSWKHLSEQPVGPPGIHALAASGLADGFAAVLGGHRFLTNRPRRRLSRLTEAVCKPAAHDSWRRQARPPGGLVSRLVRPDLPRTRPKADQAQLNQRKKPRLRVEQTLLVEGSAGCPVAPNGAADHMATAGGGVQNHATPRARTRALSVAEVPLPSIASRRGALGLGGPLVCMSADREARRAWPHYRTGRRTANYFRYADNQSRPQWYDGQGAEACWPSWPGGMRSAAAGR